MNSFICHEDWNVSFLQGAKLLRLCKGGPPLPSKFNPLLPAPQVLFTTDPQINFAKPKKVLETQF